MRLHTNACARGRGGAGSNYPFLTSQERDPETGLDYFGARYYASTQGRFTSPDDFINDTHVADPQSWNLYTYVRNNPLNLIDPSGEKGEITASYDKATNTTTITITASFVVYGAAGQSVSAEQAQEYAAALKSGIEQEYSGQWSVDGRNFVMSANITVQTAANEQAAINSGAGNLVELGNQQLQSLQFGDNPVEAYATTFHVKGENFDRMVANIGERPQDPLERNLSFSKVFAHEFSHLLGTYGHTSSPSSLFNQGFFQSSSITATALKHLFYADEINYELIGKTVYVTRPSPIMTSKNPSYETRSSKAVYTDKAQAYRWVERVKSD